MKVGDLVNYKMKLPRINGRGCRPGIRMPEIDYSFGVGVVISCEYLLGIEVLWSKNDKLTSHGLHELVPYESR